MLAYLNRGGGIDDCLAVLLSTWEMPRSDSGGRPGCVAADLTGDGSLDLAVVMTDPDVNYTPGIVGSLILFDKADGEASYEVATIFDGGSNAAASLPNPRLVAAEDLTGDDVAEVVLTSTECGAHTCYTTVYVLGWSQATGQYRELTGGSIAMPSATVSVNKHEGGVDLVLHGGAIGSVGAGPQRTRTEVYRWDEQQFALVETSFDPSPYLYFKILDANQAFASQDYETAIDLYTQAIEDTSLRPWKEEVGMGSDTANELRAFAAFRIGLAYLRLGDADQGIGALQQAAATYAETLHAGVITSFLGAYETASGQGVSLSRAYNAGCNAVDSYVNAPENLGQFTNSWYYGYANPTLAEIDLCPGL